MNEKQAQHCCDRLRVQVEMRCEQHPEPGSCGDYLVVYSAQFDEYGLWIHDGENGSASSSLTIGYCPFCGAELPDSRRDQWFAELEARGIDPDEAPTEMLVYGWWRLERQ